MILFNPTPPYLVKPEMQIAIEWANEELEKKEIHPLLIVANFIFEFLAIHPFEDGNGRLSRALTNLMLLQQGYKFIPYVSLEEIIESRQSEYYISLRQTQKNHKTDDENIEPWLLFFLDCILEQTKQALKLVDGNDPTKLLSEIQKGGRSESYTYEKDALENLKKVLSRYPGRVPVYLNFLKPDGNRTLLSVGKTLSVDPVEGLLRDIEKIFGRDVVSFKT